jgi:hypothetical protein
MARLGLIVRWLSGSTFAFALVACSSATPAAQKSVTVSESKDGQGVVVAVSEALARQLIEDTFGSELSCDGELDAEFEAMLRTLDRQGRGARATISDDDSVVTARRRGRTVEFDVRDLEGGAKIQVVMPWSVAKCLLGETTTVGKEFGDVRVTIEGKGGGSFEFRVE